MSAHLDFAQLVDYWTRDADTDAIEDHLFGCEPCAQEAERVARIIRAFRSQVPPVISHDELDALKAKGARIEENDFHPGTRTEVTFGNQLELLIHHLTGLDLHDAERVALTVRTESSGAIIHQEPFAPFDRARGEVLIACQRHFGALPPDIAFEVEVHRPNRPPTTATYSIPHVFIP